jgi:hypothetical protein
MLVADTLFNIIFRQRTRILLLVLICPVWIMYYGLLSCGIYSYVALKYGDVMVSNNCTIMLNKINGFNSYEIYRLNNIYTTEQLLCHCLMIQIICMFDIRLDRLIQDSIIH